MTSVACALLPAQATDVVPLAELLAYTRALGLAQWLRRPERGLSTVVLSLVWLVLAWHGSGRPYHLAHLEEPLLATLLGLPELPTAETLQRSLAIFPPRRCGGPSKPPTGPNRRGALRASGPRWTRTTCLTGGAAGGTGRRRAARAPTVAAPEST